MPVTFVKGDFINSPPKGNPRAFACPVDVNGTTDAGIASAVAKQWPGFGEWWSAQRKQIGDVAVFEAGDALIFALAIHRGAKRGKLGWLERGVRSMLAEAEKRNVTHINVPRLWGGVSQLEGARAKRIIEDAAMPAPLQVTVFEQFIRGAELPPDPEEELDDDADEEEDAEDEDSEEESPAPKKKKASSKKKSAAPAKKKKSAAAPAKKKPAAAPAKKKSASAPAKKKPAPAKKKTAGKKK